MAVVQVVMAFALLYYAMGWPGDIFVTTVLIGLSYGAHRATVPAAASELFGLKSFGALYNFLTLASPAGSLIFSAIIASGIYDQYAEKQAGLLRKYNGNMLTGVNSFIELTLGWIPSRGRKLEQALFLHIILPNQQLKAILDYISQ